MNDPINWAFGVVLLVLYLRLFYGFVFVSSLYGVGCALGRHTFRVVGTSHGMIRTKKGERGLTATSSPVIKCHCGVYKA